MGLLLNKIISMLAMAFLSLFFGLLPLKVDRVIRGKQDSSPRRKKRGEQVVSCLLCFGAGVLMATTFLHMLPEIREGFNLARNYDILPVGGGREHIDPAVRDELHHLHPYNIHLNDTHDIHIHVDLHNSSYDGHDHGTKDHSHDHGSTDHSHDHVSADQNHDHGVTDHSHDHGAPDHSHDHGPIDRNNDPGSVDHSHDHGSVDHGPTDHTHDLGSGDHSHDHESVDHGPMDHSHDHGSTDHSHDPVLADQSHDHDNHTNSGDNLRDQGRGNVEASREDHDHGRVDFRMSRAEEGDTERGTPDDHLQDSTTDTPPSDVTPDQMATGIPSKESGETPLDTTTFSIRTTERPSGLKDKPEKSKEVHVHEEGEPLPTPMRHTLDPGNDHDHDFHAHDHHGEGHNHEDEHNFPLAELCVCVGFFIIYVIEEMVNKVVSRREKLNEKKGCGPSMDVSLGSLPTENAINEHASVYVVPMRNSPQENQCSYENGSFCGKPTRSAGIDNPAFDDKDDVTTSPALKTLAGAEEGHGHSHAHGVTNLSGLTFLEKFRSIFIIMALSIHAIFEGMAIGLQGTSEDVWYLWGAIAAHKFVICFSVGIELLSRGISKRLMVINMASFSAVSPIGIIIGILVTDSNLLATTILQGVAGGTILYVVFFEIMERERTKPGSRIWKMLSFIVGFIVMGILESVGSHEH